ETFTPCPRPVDLGRKVPLLAAPPSTGAPSEAPATLTVSPANGRKRPVHNGHSHTWQPTAKGGGIGAHGARPRPVPCPRARRRPAAESRSRGVGPRGDDDRARRDRRGERDPRRLRLLPRVAREDLPRRAPAVRQERA